MPQTDAIVAEAQRVLRAAASMLPHDSPNPLGRRYLLPCTFLEYGGLYEYVLVDLPQARQWLLAGPVQGHISHPFLFQALLHLIGFMIPPPQRGPLPSLGYHDEALVFQLEGYETLPDLRRGDSQAIRRLVEEDRFTMGLLRRLA
jgi:hypothetical protein